MTPVENPSARVGHLLQEALADHPSSCCAVGFVSLRGPLSGASASIAHDSLGGSVRLHFNRVATDTCLVFSGTAEEEHQVCLTVLFSFSGFLLQSTAVAEGLGGGVPLWRSCGDAGRQQDRPGRGAGGDLGGGPGDCPYVSGGEMGGTPNTPDHLLTQPRVHTQFPIQFPFWAEVSGLSWEGQTQRWWLPAAGRALSITIDPTPTLGTEGQQGQAALGTRKPRPSPPSPPLSNVGFWSSSLCSTNCSRSTC